MIAPNDLEEVKKFVEKLKLNVSNPITIQDKIAWLKVYDNIPLKTFCADKLAVRTFVNTILKKDICIPLLKIYSSPDSIDLSSLPNEFVLKCNHGSGCNIIVNDKEKIDLASIKTQLKQWIDEDYFKRGFEIQYANIPHLCFAEKLLKQNGSEILDYKFWCSKGISKFFTINDGNGHGSINHYNMDCSPMGISRTDYKADYSKKYTIPSNFSEMVSIAEKLSKPFKFVRVDLYNIDGQIYFGEMTFTPGNGRMEYTDDNAGKMLGDLIDIK